MKNRNGTKLNTLGTVLVGVGSVFATTNLMAMTPVAHAHAHPGVEVKTQGNLDVVDHAYKHHWFKIHGRIQADNTIFMGNQANLNNQFPSGANLRSVRLGVNGGVSHHWSYKFELNYGNPASVYGSTSASNVYVKNAYLNYAGLHPMSNVRVGQITPRFGLEETSSTNDTVFMEYSLASSTFAAPDSLGVYADIMPNEMFAMQFAAYQPDANNSSTAGTASSSPYGSGGSPVGAVPNNSKSDRWGGTARVVFSPVHNQEVVYHLGLSALHQSLLATNYITGAASNVSLYNGSSNLEAQARTTPNLLGLGTGAGAVNAPQRLKYFQQGAIEVAAIMGPLLLQGEYFAAKLNRFDSSLSDLKPKGWYGQVAYMLTGEMRPYDAREGSIGRPKPQAECGAWEIAARLSGLSLRSQEVNGGSQHDATLGVNWYANHNVRMSANYVRASIHPADDKIIASLPAKRKVNSLALRFQAAW